MNKMINKKLYQNYKKQNKYYLIMEKILNYWHQK